jgi:hypothetical protein
MLVIAPADSIGRTGYASPAVSSAKTGNQKNCPVRLPSRRVNATDAVYGQNVSSLISSAKAFQARLIET